MINFHKYSFLDCKRLRTYLKDSHSFLTEYNPMWLFIWSDIYKPEISFTNEYIFIRYIVPEIGKVYYPPLPVQGGNLQMTLLEMEDDAKERNIPFYLGPLLDNDLSTYKALSINLKEVEKKNTWILSSDNLANLDKSRGFKNEIKSFNKEHKNCFLKKTVKEDFPALIEFLSVYRETAKIDKDDFNFFPKLNALKKCMEHLYELDLIGVTLQDENEVYGFAIGSIMDNAFYIHLTFAREDVPGAKATLISGITKYAGAVTRFVSIPAPSDDFTRDFYEKAGVQRMEKYNATFQIKE
ncbi:MAG: hypothetical protein K6A63_00870 [Acholeplasmatales bacterium]|nr:hypothetical protein [Acholeplasmatales bacterium]